MRTNYDAIIIGAGAAGLLCAALAGQRGLHILLIEHNDKVGQKIKISGGGRCNFTNLHCGPKNFISNNPHFVKSALKRFGVWDFIDLLVQHDIAYFEKINAKDGSEELTLGQLFCETSSQAVIDMLMAECQKATAQGGSVEVLTETTVSRYAYKDNRYHIFTDGKRTAEMTAAQMVVATGGASIPKLGATSFGYKVAEKFGHKIVTPEPALVPLTFSGKLEEQFAELSGVSTRINTSCRYDDKQKGEFDEAMLFTHRGLSGPAILQISSYWHAGQAIEIDFDHLHQVGVKLREARKATPKQAFSTVLAQIFPKRLAAFFYEGYLKNNKDLPHQRMADMADRHIDDFVAYLKKFQVKPTGTEGFRKAEVTRGGVDTFELSSKTMQSNLQAGLYFIGEVVDVTGHLGGHNFQWAWSSAAAAASALIKEGA